MDPGEEGGAPCHHVAPGTPVGTETGSAPLPARGPVLATLPAPRALCPSFTFIWDSPSTLLPVADTTVHLFLSPVPMSGRVGTAQVTAWQLGF